jgi:hypothetical protein
MTMRGTLSRGCAAALATGFMALPPNAQAERLDLSPSGIFDLNCRVSGIGCEATPLLRTLAGLSDERTSGDDADNSSSPVPVNPNPNPPTATVTAIPEPSTWALMLLWFAGLAYAGLRKRRRPERFTL